MGPGHISWYHVVWQYNDMCLDGRNSARPLLLRSSCSVYFPYAVLILNTEV